ncbi:MAG: methylenetetrahydrofolate--tRNA-(uracil(54)-C(5))-methyltransferase (FADH(2)-oxidizing) TrmFO [Bdellovibrionales bacterium]
MGVSKTTVHIVGAGLAGSECAWQLAEKGHRVKLYEMRGRTMTPAHKTADFAELVCSNSFGSETDYSAPGQLKWEARQLGSLILQSAEASKIPAGMALGVDRVRFAAEITAKIRNHPLIEIVEEVVDNLDDVPRPTVIATGPLTHDRLAESMREHFDSEFMYFFDAIAPVIETDSINDFVAFKADRFNRGNKDYYNCGMERDQYYVFIEEIQKARKIEPKEFEKNTPYFEGCMPIEAMIERGIETPRFGPMSPKGIRNPKNDRGYFAVVQLRQENKEGTAYNMVGFQTKMAYGEQQRIFRMIPGLENAEFLKLGSMHRNLYIQSPKKLTPFLQSRKDEWLFFAGQITGVEGYFDSTCIGLQVARFLDDKLNDRPMSKPPRETAFGSLLNAITEDFEHFQPTNINFSLFPNLVDPRIRHKSDKQLKKELQLERAKRAMLEYLGRPQDLRESTDRQSARA